jgi:Ig-like domain from next to BRCA1 gene
MDHISSKVLPGIILLSAILINACGSSASSTDTLNVTYTAAAQTVESQYTIAAQAAADQNATSLAAGPTSDISSPTNLPVPIFSPATSTADTTTFTGTACDGASYISDVTIPDNTVVPAGETFVKTWMFQNTGSCTWDANYTLTLTSGDSMDGTNTSISGSVVPGQEAELSVTLIAPTTAGQYTGYWRLANDSGQTFGTTVYVSIDVIEAASATPTFTPQIPTASATAMTPSPTASLSTPATETSQPTASSTPEQPTATSTNTSAPAPSDTPTPTATVLPTNPPLPTSTSTPEN